MDAFGPKITNYSSMLLYALRERFLGYKHGHVSATLFEKALLTQIPSPSLVSRVSLVRAVVKTTVRSPPEGRNKNSPVPLRQTKHPAKTKKQTHERLPHKPIRAPV